MTNGFAAEDAFNAQDDLERQRAWFEEVEADITALEEEKAGYVNESNLVHPDNQARFNAIGDQDSGELQPLY